MGQRRKQRQHVMGTKKSCDCAPPRPRPRLNYFENCSGDEVVTIKLSSLRQLHVTHSVRLILPLVARHALKCSHCSLVITPMKNTCIGISIFICRHICEVSVAFPFESNRLLVTMPALKSCIGLMGTEVAREELESMTGVACETSRTTHALA